MSIQFLRGLIGAIDVVCAVAMVGIVVALSQFRADMDSPRKWQSFTIDRAGVINLSTLGQTAFTGIPLGLWRSPERETDAPEAPVSEERTRMEDLGTILGVVAVKHGGTDGLQSSITFRKKSGDVETLAIGDAIETRAHPHFGTLIRVPAKYQLVACNADPKDAAIAHIVFDMECDRSELQEVVWNSRSGPRHVDATPRRVERVLPNAVVISVEEFERHRNAQPRKRVDWKAELEAVQTTSYRPRGSTKSEGIVITAVPRRSQAARVGLRNDDVILSINGRAVTSKAEALKVGRDEVEKLGRKVLEVRMLRNGKEITRQYDVSEHR